MPGKYKHLDIPEITGFLFHPRKEGYSGGTSAGENIDIPVSGGVTIGGKLFKVSESSPLILFFHGNGEIVSDYDDLGPIFNSLNINFMPVDYRGYGRSTGTPAVSSMLSDAAEILEFTLKFKKEKAISGPLIVMGRSLGSASALEIASLYEDRIDGLIIESGFAYIVPLLNLLGIRTAGRGITEEQGLNHIEKIRNYRGPLLVIHAEYDHIIPHSDGEALYNEAGSKNRKMVTIKSANHNNIFMMGIDLYMSSIGSFAAGLS